MKPVQLGSLLILLAAVGCAQTLVQTPGPLEGAWLVDEIRMIGPEGESVNPSPQPGLYIFSGRHYSMVWMPWSEPRGDFARKWYPTDAEKIASFDAVIVNSGTFELDGSTLTTIPIVAKTPEFMGGIAVYECRFEGDALWLTMTDNTSHDGVQDPGVLEYRIPVKLVRAEREP
jgi:hypothetical protein